MKFYGKIDARGRVTVDKTVRDTLKLETGDVVECDITKVEEQGWQTKKQS